MQCTSTAWHQNAVVRCMASSSALFAIAQGGDVAALRKVLASFPSAVLAKTYKDKTALHLAATQGHLEAVTELLAAGAAKDAQDNSGCLALHLAAEQGHADVVRELLQGSGRLLAVKAKNHQGATPLHCAVRNKHADVCRRLVEAGARPDVRDKAGQTALDLAAGDEALLQVLQPMPAQPGAMTMRSSIAFPPKASILAAAAAEAATEKPAPRAAADPDIPELKVSTTLPTAREPSVLHTARGPIGGQSLRQSINLPKTARGPAVNRRPPSAIPTPSVSTRPASGAAPAPSAASVRVDAHDAQLLQLCTSVFQLQEALRQANERLEKQEVAGREASVAMEDRLTKALETVAGQASRLEELESRLLYHEEKSKESRARVDKLDQVQQELAGRAAQPSILSLAVHEQQTAAAIHSITAQLGRLEVSSSSSREALELGSTLQGRIAGMEQRLQETVAFQGSHAADVDNRLSDLSTSLAGVREDMTRLRSELEAVNKWQQQQRQQQGQGQGQGQQQQQQGQQVTGASRDSSSGAEALHHSAPGDLSEPSAGPHSRNTVHRRTADAQVRPDYTAVTPPGRGADSSHGGAGADPWANTPLGGPRGLGTVPNSSFVQRLEFESSMQRVEERAREAAEKEATAKKWMQQARDTEEWRAEREQREESASLAIKGLEADLEQTKLKVGALESQVQDLQQLTAPPSPLTRLQAK